MEMPKESKTASTCILRPLPGSLEGFQKELTSFQTLDPGSEPPPRAKLYHHVLSSVKINRPFQSAMILLVGGSGVGKSSTINHLLDTGEGLPVAKTSATESETKSTSEYVLTVDEPSYEVCDLKMSVIDTPGFNDTGGINQDACNFLSIKRFFETHPSLSKQWTYPNLIFLVVSAMDQRIKGPDSNLSKNLRSIKLLQVVDKNCPNLVIIVTFCCSVAYKDVDKWKRKMRDKKNVISTVVFEVLGVQAPVVFLENGAYDHDLEKKGDFTILPDGERQPKNLYNACQKLLERSEDRFGCLVLNAVFTRTKKDCPTNGHKVEANSCVEKLSDGERLRFDDYIKFAGGRLEDPLAMRAMEYIEEKKLDETQKQEIFALVKSMKSLGMNDASSLQFVTFGEINSIHHGNISTRGVEMLETKFGIKRECAPFNSADFFGRGYDVISEKSVPAQIMKFSAVDDTTFGFRMPLCAQIEKVNETRMFEMDFESNESYMVSKLQNLSLNANLAPSILRMAPQCGLSSSCKNNKSSKSSETTKTSLTEYRIARINIANFESKDVQFTSEFSTAVANLPDRYTDEEKTKHEFTKFFNRFGQFVVRSACVGGAVEVKTWNESSEISKNDENYALKASAGAHIPGGSEINLSGKNQPSIKSETNAALSRTETRWQGGQSDLHDKSTLQSDEKFQMWKASLSKEPILLTNEMNLEPISSLVAIIDETKGDVCDQALHDMFQSDLRPVRNRHDKEVLEAKQKLEAEDEKQRNESNTRMESKKDPDVKGWWETVTGSMYTVAGGVGVIIIGVCTLVLMRLKR